MPNEVNLALKLIEGMTAEFDPAKYHDTYTEEVKRRIDERPRDRNARRRRHQCLPPNNVIDIVAALQESPAQKKPRKRGAA